MEKILGTLLFPWCIPYVNLALNRIENKYWKSLGFNISAEDNGSIILEATYDETNHINKEEPIYITASANEGYEFVSWSNGSTDSTIELDITNPTELVATFKEVEEESIDNLEEPSKSLYLLPNTNKDTKPLYL